jgi:hypothetical protein
MSNVMNLSSIWQSTLALASAGALVSVTAAVNTKTMKATGVLNAARAFF